VTGAPYRSLFVGHGAPTLAASTHPAARFLDALGERLPRPTAVIVVSPHSTATSFVIKAPTRFKTWHDFRGFPPELYALEYAPPGDAALAERVRQAIGAAGLPAAASDDARLDHGAWVPLRRLWPDATVPVVQISIRADAGPAEHWALGAALGPLLSDDVLLLGSGSVTHNLGDFDADEAAPERPWARAFADWLQQRMAAGDRAALLDYRRRAPAAQHAQPHDDHLLPLFVAAAAGNGVAEPLFRGMTYGSIGMDAYGWR